MARIGGKVCIVTGAGRGIGAAIAVTLAREGGLVLLTDLDAKTVSDTAAGIIAAGGTALAAAQDVADEKRWAEIVALAVERFGRVDVLVNNAGWVMQAALVDTTLDAWRRQMAVNCDGVFLGMKHAIPAMAKGGGGSIINISSILGKVGATNVSAYCASKGAVTLMTKAAAIECAPVGVRVNSLHPGFIRTPAFAEGLGQEGQAAIDAVTALHPIGRLGDADEVADAALFLASNDSRFMTGSELIVDGGYTAA